MDFKAEPGQQGVPQDIPITNDGPPSEGAQNNLKPIREAFVHLKINLKRKIKNVGCVIRNG